MHGIFFFILFSMYCKPNVRSIPPIFNLLSMQCHFLEPDHFSFPHNISASVLASNFEALRQLLVEMKYPLLFLAGPDVASLETDKIYSQ